MSEFTERPIRSVDDVGGFFITGTVIGANTWSETHFSSTTTGSSASGGYGTTVSSAVTEVNRFFLQRGDKEEEIKLEGGKFAVRDGHIVSIIRVGPKDERWRYNLAYYNHSTDKLDAREEWLEWSIDKSLKNLKSIPVLVMATLGAALMIFVDARGGTILLIVVLAMLFGVARKRNKYRRLITAIRARRQHELEAAKAAYASSKARDDHWEKVAS